MYANDAGPASGRRKAIPTVPDTSLMSRMKAPIVVPSATFTFGRMAKILVSFADRVMAGKLKRTIEDGDCSASRFPNSSTRSRAETDARPKVPRRDTFIPST